MYHFALYPVIVYERLIINIKIILFECIGGSLMALLPETEQKLMFQNLFRRRPHLVHKIVYINDYRVINNPIIAIK